MIASASMLFANPAVVATPTTSAQPAAPSAATAQTTQPVIVQERMIITKGQGTGMGMMKNQKCNMMHNKMNKRMMKNKMKMNSPFLIQHGLPHLTKMIMPYMNDPEFNLTDAQKAKLLNVRKNTMPVVMKAKLAVKQLRSEIVKASTAGVPSKQLEEKVAKLALIQAEATMAHLKCIEATKEILTKDQMYFLLTNKNKNKNHAKKQMMRQKMMKMKVQQPAMKCAAGKCGQGMSK